MKLTSVRIRNYKCFSDTGEIPIGQNCTVIVGQNNVGKTALLDALASPRLQDRPHREPQTENFPYIEVPSFTVSYGISMSGAELKYRILQHGSPVAFAVPRGTPAITENLVKGGEAVLDAENLPFALAYRPNNWSSEVNPTLSLFTKDAMTTVAAFQPTPDRRSVSIVGQNTNENLIGFIASAFQASAYVFRAERLNIGEAEIGATPELLPDASNLPSVLLHLPSNAAAYQRYIESVRQVFPTVFGVASSPISPNRAKISLTMNYAANDKPAPGIDVSLLDSGTGLSQVLAMLYVAITAPAPRILVIDEPNSFLHPGAAKKLLAILRKFDHQYIISTHSPDIIRTLDPDYVHLLEWNGRSSAFRTMNSTDVADQRRILTEVGVRLSDVFGSDNVLWVEGKTEEQCFPLLLAYMQINANATSIVPLIATGDFDTKHKPRAALSWDVYRQLSSASALLPPTLAFSLDREGRKQTEMDDLVRQSGGLIKFLPRATYENYLLDSDAISSILSEEMQGGGVSVDQVGMWMKARVNLADKKETAEWLRDANGAKILDELFNDLSEARHTYRKTTHSAALTKWLLANKPEALSELCQYVREFFDAAKTK
jgi:AAA ATPase domain/AAA domain, putative AbiEii toxin, Type IV TA system